MYFDEGKATGAYTRKLDDAVKSVKASEERRHEYMVMMIREMEAREEAREEGREEGRQEGAMAERERVALNMLRESGPAISVSFIAKMTGFSEDEVMDLAKENGIALL